MLRIVPVLAALAVLGLSAIAEAAPRVVVTSRSVSVGRAPVVVSRSSVVVSKPAVIVHRSSVGYGYNRAAVVVGSSYGSYYAPPVASIVTPTYSAPIVQSVYTQPVVQPVVVQPIVTQTVQVPVQPVVQTVVQPVVVQAVSAPVYPVVQAIVTPTYNTYGYGGAALIRSGYGYGYNRSAVIVGGGYGGRAAIVIRR